MARTVWSSEHGSVCPRCGHPVDRCACAARNAAAYDASKPVVVRRETKGRKGKGVTVVENVPLAGDELRSLAKALKQRCGSGGTLKDGVIEIQGEHRNTVTALIAERGWKVRKG